MYIVEPPAAAWGFWTVRDTSRLEEQDFGDGFVDVQAEVLRVSGKVPDAERIARDLCESLNAKRAA